MSADAWRTISPIGESKVEKIVPTYESTFGGPIVRDRTWFFVAARSVKNEVARETRITKQAYTRTLDERRLEAKVTQSLGTGRRLSVNYLAIDSATTNSAYPSSAEIMDLASLTNPKTPERLGGVHFAGTFGSRVFLEAQYSARTLTFGPTGASPWAPSHVAAIARGGEGLEPLATRGRRGSPGGSRPRRASHLSCRSRTGRVYGRARAR